MTCSNVRRMESADAAYEWKLWLRTRQTSTFPSSAVASFSSSLKLVIIRYESFHSVHYALRRRRPDKLNIFLAQGKGNEREIYGDSMRTSIKLIVMVVTLWADYLLPFFFAGGRMKIVSEPFIISTLRSEERRCRLRLLPSTRLPVAFQSKANGKQSTEVSKEKQDDNAQILFLFHCKRCISALVTIPYTS